jgi:predicted MFS family arabinose efflux permease
MRDGTSTLQELTAASTTPRAWLLALLCATMLFNFLDRQIFAILLESIKQDLEVSDTAMGLLTGGAFAVVYVIAGVPLARAADVGTRRSILAGCLFVWSALTFTCGLAVNYTQLILMRMGVAIGEAGANPTTYSLISDLYPPNERPGVIGTIYFWSACGIGASMLAGGWLNQLVGWRLTLMFVAVPGLILALLIRLTVREPARGGGMADRSIDFGGAIRAVARIPSFLCVTLFSALSGFTGYGLLTWAPTFLIRVHQMPLAQVGLVMGLTAGLGAGIGSLVGGRIANLLAARDYRFLLRFCAVVVTAALPFHLIFLHSETISVGLAGFTVASILMGGAQPTYYAIALSIVPARTRGLATAALTMAQNLGGIALGVVAGGLLNDLLTPRFGVTAIRYSLTLLLAGLIGAAMVALIGTRWVRSDFDRARQVTA